MSDRSKLARIIGDNLNKSFVQRIAFYTEGRSPTLQNPDGTISTHSMASGEADGKYYAYPTVVMGQGDRLQRLSGDDAWRNAMDTGNYIEFDSEKEAEWFSKNYKKYWEK